jgi:hypothetical protein
MAEGLGRERWAHTSMLCCLIANANRDPKKHRPFKPSDFDPYSKTARSTGGVSNQYEPDDLQLLREALTRMKGKRHDH